MPLIRLKPFSAQSIPAHPALSTLQDSSGSPTTNEFVAKALEEALTFAKGDVPAFGEPTKKSKGSTAPVAIRTWSRNNNVEHWVARYSRHMGKPENGDADWDEFNLGLRENHSLNEMAYTPGVTDAVEVCRWDTEQIGTIDGWQSANMAVFEMKHHLPAPLKERVFTILIINGIPVSTTGRSFITLTIPLDLKTTDNSKKVGSAKYVDSSAVVHAAYVSVEHVYEEADSIVWMMATASDAKGNLPMSVQKLGVPGAITKDVGLLLSWLAERRSKA
ncbi:hypothetical protein BT63DRAFT_126662 [Microthyrium microscopicum]|uniref:DUF3074 domain-containing protein n=1 Tax=Microthyrium microscopicum TaxID=703497 RepID=A0A6A6TW99_9PEZI|nr:hypothetical protein BT63DRAFT_126662 [Microthyrium microscopicum]